MLSAKDIFVKDEIHAKKIVADEIIVNDVYAKDVLVSWEGYIGSTSTRITPLEITMDSEQGRRTIQATQQTKADDKYYKILD